MNNLESWGDKRDRLIWTICSLMPSGIPLRWLSILSGFGESPERDWNSISTLWITQTELTSPLLKIIKSSAKQRWEILFFWHLQWNLNSALSQPPSPLKIACKSPLTFIENWNAVIQTMIHPTTCSGKLILISIALMKSHLTESYAFIRSAFTAQRADRHFYGTLSSIPRQLFVLNDFIKKKDPFLPFLLIFFRHLELFFAWHGTACYLHEWLIKVRCVRIYFNFYKQFIPLNSALLIEK